MQGVGAPRGRYPTAQSRRSRFPDQSPALRIMASLRRSDAEPQNSASRILVARKNFAAYTFGSVFGFKGAGL
jgi:hypothetical protein